MDGRKYERRVAYYLRNHGFHNVTITKTSGDYGVDILATKMFHKYAIQCKYYSKPVGISAVQQVVAGMAYYDCDRAIVVTNNKFTRQAKQLAEHNSVILMENIKGSYSMLTILLLRLCAIVSLYLIYIMGYKMISIGIIIIAVCLLIIGLYLKLVVNREDIQDNDKEEADPEE